MAGDSYRTVAAPAEAACRERSSKFLSWIYPVRTEEEIRERLDALRREPRALDLDGVKRRTRSGMGRCQGGF